MTSEIWWYVARSGGIVALALTGLSVIWGLLYSTRVLQGRPTPKWTLDLHKFLGLSSVAFTGVHVAALMLDSYIQFSWLDILVPFVSAWNPLGVALGIVAAYLLLAVQISSAFMRKMPRPWWKRIHLTSYGLFWLGIVHGIVAGTDAGNPLYVLASSASIITVLFLTVYRVLTQRKLSRSDRPVRTGVPSGVS
ncbi:MAG: ferric reductase-like transmembrane domain-containing protein [Acidimicrobiales bacterium]